MDTVIINGQAYDPYFILDVTPDDTSEYIAKAYRKNARRYHPDKCTSSDPKQKKKMEKQFGVITECYQYIIEKRHKHEVKRQRHHVIIPSNEQTQTQTPPPPTTFGYGNHEKISNIKEYDSFETKCHNQFQGKKFSTKEFNKIFQYNKELNKESNPTEKENQVSLVHKTSDGFYGYNTSDIKSYGLVSSFNGLMLVCDDFGESGDGYWSNHYGDYKQSYASARNPEAKLKVPKTFKLSQDIKRETRQETEPVSSIGMAQSKEMLYERQRLEIEKKMQKDKELVVKNKHKFDAKLFAKALNGDLDESPSFLGALQEHHNKTIQYDKP
jgi:curved DNA-binding protein CbpA